MNRLHCGIKYYQKFYYKMTKFYPINNWAHIAPAQVDYLMKIINESTFNSNSDIDLLTQVYDYLNFRKEYISRKQWLLFSSDEKQVAFNIGLKPRLELGDDYIFAIFSKNKESEKQEWKLLCFSIRGKDSLKYGTTDIDIDLYRDCSQTISQETIPTQFDLSFGFNHLFLNEERIKRIPDKILQLFPNWKDDAIQRRILSSLIKFAVLNDYENISRYNRTDNNEKQITTSFDPDKFLVCLNTGNNEKLPKKKRVLNESPYSYLYPVCIQNPVIPDFAIVFRKTKKGKQFIGKTILKLSDAQMNARIFKTDLEGTWLSNENVNRNLEDKIK